MPIIKVIIPGIPIAKKRARSRGFGKPYNCQKREENQFILVAATQIKKKAPRTEPVALKCVFWFAVPKSASSSDKRTINDNSGAHIFRLDNCLKFVKDNLNNLAWEDDCQVASVECRKMYGAIPRTDIEIKWTERIRLEEAAGKRRTGNVCDL